MKVDSLNFNRCDQLLYELLSASVDKMPIRFVKMIAYYYTDARVRKQYWKRLGVDMGDGTFSNLGMMVVGSNEKKIRIGCNVSIAPFVTFVLHSSPNNGCEITELTYIKETLEQDADIIVEDEVWIGANVTILPGVHIGRCSVIGAGSVVTKDVESYSVYAGVPARKIRDLKTGERT